MILLRLYVICRNPQCNTRIYLQSPAQLKTELPIFFSLQCSNCNLHHTYSRNEVIAETNNGAGIGGAVAGGALGLIGGPIGLILGAIIGGIAGGAADREDEEKVRRFNEAI